MNVALAACRDTGNDMFPGSTDSRGALMAKARCQVCPIRLECLAEALNRREEHGVWGGMTVRERKRLLKQYPGVPDWGRLLGVVDLVA